MNICELREKLKYIIPKGRFEHSLGVEQECMRFVHEFSVDEEQVRVAALLHDITKTLKMDEQLDIIKKYEIKLTDLEKKSPKLLHAITGAYIAKNEYGVCDAVFDAILHHTTAKARMSKLAKILYMADFTEQGRTYDGVDKIRRITYDNFDKGFIYALDFSISDLLEKGALIHPNTVAARNDGIMKAEVI